MPRSRKQPLYNAIKKRRSGVKARAEAWGGADYLHPEVEAEFKRMGLSLPEKQYWGVLGEADKHFYIKCPVELWSRKEIYNRVRWLRGKLTRQIVAPRPTTEAEKTKRHAAIMETRRKIEKYTDALKRLKPQHDEIRREKHNDKRKKDRAKAKASKLKALAAEWKEKRNRFKGLLTKPAK